MNQVLAGNTAVFSFSTGILLASAALLVFCLLALRHYRKTLKQDRGRLNTMQQDMRALTNAAVGMGERMLEMERRQRRLAERQEQADIYDSANQPYEQAIHMAQSGAAVEELVKTCGLSTTEAELIQMMHRLDKAS